MTTYARAHTNIALIKYWGKANRKLMLPATSSISLTLNDFYTDTAVTFDPSLNDDRFMLNGEEQNPVAVSRAGKFSLCFCCLGHCCQPRGRSKPFSD